MYAAIWRKLPGPLWLRLVTVVLLLSAVLAVLVLWVFPYVDQLLAPQEVTVQE